MMQGVGSSSRRDDHRDIDKQLRLEMLSKLITDQLKDGSPCDHNSLKFSASRFEKLTYETAKNKKEYLMAMSRRPVTLLPPNVGLTIPGSSLARPVSANGAASITQNPRHDVFHSPQIGNPSRISSSQASGNFPSSIQRVQQPQSFTRPFPRPSHQAAFPNQQFRQQMNFSNHMPHQQQQEGNHNIVQRQPYQGLFQGKSNCNYQQQQQSIRYQSPLHLNAVRISGGPNSQIDHVVATQQMINNQRVQQPNQLRSINALQDPVLRNSYAGNIQNEASRTLDPHLYQLSKTKAIQESQGSTIPGSKDCPIPVSEDNKNWHDSAYQEIQKCKEECLPVVLKIYKHSFSRHYQRNTEDKVKMAVKVKQMIELLNMQRSGMEQITQETVYRFIDKIYTLSRDMRKKYPMLFPKHGEESKPVDSEEQQQVPPAVTEANHNHPQHDPSYQQGAEAGSESENIVVMPLQLAKTSTDNQPTDDPTAVAVTHSNNDLQRVNESSPIDRLIKAVNEASAATLTCAAHDIHAVMSVTDRMYEIPAYENGKSYISDDLASATAYRLHTQDMPNQGMKRNIEAVAVYDFYNIDRLIDSGDHMLYSSQTATEKSERCKIEANNNLMTEMEFLNGSLIETAVAVVESEAGSRTLEDGREITVACTYRPASSIALNELSRLFPVRMQLRIPREYPRSRPTILCCSHQNCGEMCDWLQMKYELWSRSSDMTSVKEIVQGWDACARDLYTDICSASGGGSLSATMGTWKQISR